MKFPLDRPPGTPFQNYFVAEPLFSSETQIGSNGWQVRADLPLLPLCGSSTIPDQWSISFGRYDYTEGNSAPMISSTSAFTICNFHRRQEWSQMHLGAVPVFKKTGK